MELLSSPLPSTASPGGWCVTAELEGSLPASRFTRDSEFGRMFEDGNAWEFMHWGGGGRTALQ